MAKIKVLDTNITIVKNHEEDYISLTDITNSKDGEHRAADVIKNWIRNRGTLEFIGTWEKIHNRDFKVVEFDNFEGMPQAERLKKLNQTAATQMQILMRDDGIKKIESYT